MTRPNQTAYWPLVRMEDDEDTPEEERFDHNGYEEVCVLRDKEVLALRVLLRYACQKILKGVLEGERESRLIGFADALESLRLKVEEALDFHFNEGRFAESEEPENTEC